MVSCIMPTRNRRRFVAQAIWYFLRQDYPHRELIILDDGEDAIHDLVPPDDRLRYVRLERPLSLAAKRHLGCGLARGELIAHWGDDDWIASERLSKQIHALLNSGADVCGTHNLLHYRLEAGEARLFHGSPAEPLADYTLVYRKSAWAASHNDSLDDGGAFVRNLPQERVCHLPDLSLYVRVLHRGNSGTYDLVDQRWEIRLFDELIHIIGVDLDYYAELRNGRSPSRAQSGPAIAIMATINTTTGYGSMAEYLILSMASAGAQLDIRPSSLQLDGVSPQFLELFRHSRLVPDAPLLYYSSLGRGLPTIASRAELFLYTMWEGDRLPHDWIAEMQQARAIIVPSRFVARVCRESGVTVPVIAIPEGVDPAIYHYQERPSGAGMTTLMVGPVDRRKNTSIGIEAWKQAFAGDSNARLIIKTNYGYHNYTPDDTRINYIDCDERTRGIAHYYHQADVLLALGNEGFGLPLSEGMATGLPVIALDSEGQSDMVEDAGELVLPVPAARREPFDWSGFGLGGMRGVPAVKDVAAQLRWVADHRGEARALGRAASAWALQHRNVWARGPAVLDVIESHLRTPRPLYRRQAIWAPSWGTICGIAEYTTHLTHNLPYVQVNTRPPDLPATRLVHIQHEFGLFSDVELSRYVQKARQSGAPVVITEHSVRNNASAWERDASALVAMTSSGVERLRARWPTKRVELLPCGCPTWFPLRKRKRGRTIGAFGFLEVHKGFWQLLDVLRALPDTELCLFSHARRPEAEANWNQAAAGLPVRRTGGFLPIEEIARQLAADTDILVFWYDEVDVASASYAIRIGMATGVPVLVSPTRWFHDLRAVTYQPDNLLLGVQRLLEDSSLRERLTAACYDYCHDHRWSAVAERHLQLWKELE